MKIRYPIEAFALAMIVFSNTMRDALITGILILFVTTLSMLINKLVGKLIPIWSRDLCNVIFVLSICYSLFYVVLVGIFGADWGTSNILYTLMVGAFIVYQIRKVEGEEDFNGLLFEGAGAYAALILIGLIREFASGGMIFETELADFAFMTRNIQGVTFGFLFAGIAIAILNRMYHYEHDRLDSLLVVLPVVLINQPFAIDNINESLSILVAVLAILGFLVSIKMHLTFSRLSKEWKRLPIELVSVSFIYMILHAL